MKEIKVTRGAYGKRIFVEHGMNVDGFDSLQEAADFIQEWYPGFEVIWDV